MYIIGKEIKLNLLVVAGDFGWCDEKVVESREVESLIVTLDDAFGVYHHDHHYDLHLFQYHDVLVYKQDYHLIIQYHRDWLIAPRNKNKMQEN